MKELIQEQPLREQLYLDYKNNVFSYLLGRVDNREDAEDLCAAVFEKALGALPEYDAKKSKISTWLYTITRNTLIDYYRTRHPTEPISNNIRAPDDLEERYIKEETLSRLAMLLKAMKQPERDIIILRYYKGYSLARISRLTGLSNGTVKAAHKRALKMLRFVLDST